MPGAGQIPASHPEHDASPALFMDHELQARRNSILHLLQMARHVLLIEGMPGSGRSTFLKGLMDEGDDLLLPLWVSVEDSADPELLAHAMIQGLRLPASPVAAGPRVIEHATEQVHELLLSGQRPVLLVDDADALGNDALLNLLLARQDSRDQEGPVAMGLVFAAEPGFADRLSNHRVLDNLQVARLPPWRDDQVAAYVHRQCLAAGYPDAAAAGIDADAIHAATGGMPGRVAEACARDLGELAAGIRQPGHHGHPEDGEAGAAGNSRRRQWLAAMAMGLGLILLAWVLASRMSTQDDARTPHAPPQPLDPGVATGSGAAPSDSRLDILAPTSTSVTIPAREQSAEPDPEQTTAFDPLRPSLGGPLPLWPAAGAGPDALDVVEREPEPDSLVGPPPDPLAEEAAEQWVDSGLAAEFGDHQAAAPDLLLPDQLRTGLWAPGEGGMDTDDAADPGGDRISDPRNDSTGESTSAGATGSRQSSVETSPRPPEAAVVPRSAPRTGTGTDGHQEWLGAQNPRHYTVQLLGASSRATTDSFMADIREQSPRLIRTTRDGKDWYVVVSGSYPDRRSAQAAIGRLPASLARHGPWPRTFGSLQTP